MTTLMVGLKNGHIGKNLAQSGEPQRYGRGTQKKKNGEPQRYGWGTQKKKNGEPQRYGRGMQKKEKNGEPQRYGWGTQKKKKNGEPQRYGWGMQKKKIKAHFPAFPVEAFSNACHTKHRKNGILLDNIINVRIF